MSAPTNTPHPPCGAKLRGERKGQRCRQPAGRGTDHLGHGRCHLHGGASPNGRMAAAKEAAAQHALRLGMPLDVGPHEALQAAVRGVAGEVRYLEAKVQALDEGEAIGKAELHHLVRALRDAHERMARISKAAVDAGVPEWAAAQMQKARTAAPVDPSVLLDIAEELGVADEFVRLLGDRIAQERDRPQILPPLEDHHLDTKELG